MSVLETLDLLHQRLTHLETWIPHKRLIPRNSLAPERLSPQVKQERLSQQVKRIIHRLQESARKFAEADLKYQYYQRELEKLRSEPQDTRDHEKENHLIQQRQYWARQCNEEHVKCDDIALEYQRLTGCSVWERVVLVHTELINTQRKLIEEQTAQS